MSYFYIVRHKPSGKKYVGIRTAKESYPGELMTEDGYKTSSNRVHRLIDNDGINSFEVLYTEEMDDPYSYETEFLVKHDCANSSEWLNCHNNDYCSPSFGTEKFKEIMIEKYGFENCMHVKEIRDKVSEKARQWVKDNPEKVKQQSEKLKKWARENPDKTKLRAEKTAANKIKNGTTGKGLSKKHTNNGKTGKWIRGEHHKEAISSRQKEISVFIHNNPMNDPEKRKLVGLSKIGRKRIYREDGSFYMSKPEK